MKRWFCVLLALLLAWLAAGAVAEGAAAGAFLDFWVGKGISVEIWADGGVLRCEVVRDEGGDASTVWEYETCRYDAAAGALVCEGGVRVREEVDAKSLDLKTETQASGLTASFAIDGNGRLIWKDSEGLADGVELLRVDSEAEEAVEAAAGAFLGSWACGRADLDVSEADGAYEVTIAWADSASEQVEWTYTCLYDDGVGVLYSIGPATKAIVEYDTGGDVASSRTEYEDGSATFALDDMGRLIWDDAKENAGEDMAFTPVPDTQEPPSAQALREGYFLPVGSWQPGKAGASLDAARIACEAMEFAAECGLYRFEAEALQENMEAAWADLDAGERTAFEAGFGAAAGLAEACQEDWAANRGVFEDAGVASRMEARLDDMLGVFAWDTLRQCTLALIGPAE